MPTRLPSVTTEAEADMKIMRTALGLILCTLITSGVAADECVNGIGDYPYFPPDRAEHFEYNLNTGYQVLIPQYTFNCYGRILEWSALTVYREVSGFSPYHVAYFQVWRPTGVGRYTRVGYDIISVHNDDIQPSYTSTTPGNGLAFYNITSVVENRSEDDEEGEDNSPLYFQPGDVLGFFIRSGQLRWPLSVTYRRPLPGDSESLVVDMFYTTTLQKSDDMQLCEMSECAENVIKIASVIPHIYFTYEPVLAAEVPQQPSNEHCYNSSVDQIECPVPTATTREPVSLTPPPTMIPNATPMSTGDPTSDTTQDTSSINTLPIIIGVIGGIIAMLMLLIVVLLVVFLTLRCRHSGKNKTADRSAVQVQRHQLEEMPSNDTSPHGYRMKINDAYECPSPNATDDDHNLHQLEEMPSHDTSPHGYRMKINDAYECPSPPVTDDDHDMVMAQNEAYPTLTTCYDYPYTYTGQIHINPNAAYEATVGGDGGNVASELIYDEVMPPHGADDDDGHKLLVCDEAESQHCQDTQ